MWAKLKVGGIYSIYTFIVWAELKVGGIGGGIYSIYTPHVGGAKSGRYL